jgi:hypothetical protein
MHAVRHDVRNNKEGGFLKTTTWGALIAVSLVLIGLGFTGHLPLCGSLVGRSHRCRGLVS